MVYCEVNKLKQLEEAANLKLFNANISYQRVVPLSQKAKIKCHTHCCLGLVKRLD